MPKKKAEVNTETTDTTPPVAEAPDAGDESDAPPDEAPDAASEETAPAAPEQIEFVLPQQDFNVARFYAVRRLERDLKHRLFYLPDVDGDVVVTVTIRK